MRVPLFIGLRRNGTTCIPRNWLRLASLFHPHSLCLLVEGWGQYRRYGVTNDANANAKLWIFKMCHFEYSLSVPVKNPGQAKPGQLPFSDHSRANGHSSVYSYCMAVCKASWLCRGSPVGIELNYSKIFKGGLANRLITSRLDLRIKINTTIHILKNTSKRDISAI